jgi:hypothetical protein
MDVYCTSDLDTLEICRRLGFVFEGSQLELDDDPFFLLDLYVLSCFLSPRLTSDGTTLVGESIGMLHTRKIRFSLTCLERRIFRHVRHHIGKSTSKRMSYFQVAMSS